MNIVDVEAAAFVYLMAETEAICKHDQDSWFSKENHNYLDCGTSACLGGHAMIYEEGSKEGGAEINKYRHSSVEATKIILKAEYQEALTIPRTKKILEHEGKERLEKVKMIANAQTDLQEVFLITSEDISDNPVLPITGDPITYEDIDEGVEEIALNEFKHWVCMYTSKEEQERFEELISLSPEKLSFHSTSDKEALKA